MQLSLIILTCGDCRLLRMVLETLDTRTIPLSVLHAAAAMVSLLQRRYVPSKVFTASCICLKAFLAPASHTQTVSFAANYCFDV